MLKREVQRSAISRQWDADTTREGRLGNLLPVITKRESPKASARPERDDPLKYSWSADFGADPGVPAIECSKMAALQ